MKLGRLALEREGWGRRRSKCSGTSAAALHKCFGLSELAALAWKPNRFLCGTLTNYHIKISNQTSKKKKNSHDFVLAILLSRRIKMGRQVP